MDLGSLCSAVGNCHRSGRWPWVTPACLHGDFIADGHLRGVPQTGKQETFCRAEITRKITVCKWFDLLIRVYRSCNVSISGKGNGTEEEWEEKGRTTTKQVGRFHLGQDLMSWVFYWAQYVVKICGHTWTLGLWVLCFERNCLNLFKLHHLGILLHREFPLVYTWNHPVRADFYLEQTSPWTTDLNFSTSVQWRSGWEQPCAGRVVTPVLHFSDFLKSPFCRKTSVVCVTSCESNPPHDVSLSKQWEAHLLPAAHYLHESIRENLSAQLIFLSLSQTFCDLPDCTSMEELTELHKLYFTITLLFILLYILCVTGLHWGNWGSCVGDDLGDDTTLQ